jgi:transposase
MRGTTTRQVTMLSTVTSDSLIPMDHPIRRIKPVVETVLAELGPEFDAMYARTGRQSVPPEQLLKATVLMALYSIRSERQFCERLRYDLLFKFFLDLNVDDEGFDHSTFSRNRERLLSHEIADRFFAAVVQQAHLRRYISGEHFSVDGTLLEAWASHKSFRPKDGGKGDPPPPGRNAEVDYHGERRSNETHQSTNDPEARLARKGNGVAAKLSYAGHLLMENRSALIADMELTSATGYAERETALTLLRRLPTPARRRTVGGDKGYDTRDFIAGCRELSVTPHVSQNTVWALRVGYVGLAVAIAGLIVMSSGSTPWVLAVGVIIWLAAAAVTLAGFFWSRHELPEPRPGYWSMRFMLIHDTVHARSS